MVAAQAWAVRVGAQAQPIGNSTVNAIASFTQCYSSSVGDSGQISALLARVGAGDRSACDPLFDAIHLPVRRFCARLLGDATNSADVADAAQEAMIKVYARASSYDPSRAAMGWVLAIAAWECRTVRRKHQRRREVPGAATPTSMTYDATSAGTAVPDDYASPAAGPAEIAQQRNLIAAATHALGILSLDDQQVLLAAYVDDEASTGQTIRKRRQRALQRLRATFRRLYGID